VPSTAPLNWRLAPKYWDHDGSLSSDFRPLTEMDISFLEGIATGCDEAAREAEKLIKLIKKYGCVEVALLG
jgi:hypothetical protein